MLKQRFLDHAGLIRLSLGLLCLVAAGLFAFNGYAVVNRIDDASHRRDVAALNKGLHLLGEITASELVGLSVWDTAFDRLVTRQDLGWMRQNLGEEIYDGTEERVLVVSPSDTILFSSRTNGPGAADEALTAATAIIARVRAQYADALIADDNAFRLELGRAGALFEGLYDYDVALVDGMPAILTVSAIVPEHNTAALTKSPPMVLLNVRTLTGPNIARLSELSQLSEIAVRPVASAEQTGPGVHVLLNRDKQSIGVVTWRAEPPGSAVAFAMLPMFGASIVLILIVAAGASRLLTLVATGLAKREAAAVHAASHDAATGLSNRPAFQRGLAEALATAGPTQSRAVILIDLDYFKSINDTLGHAAGDAVLVATAQRMRSLGAEAAVLARLGGDEFAAVSLAAADTTTLTEFCARLHAVIALPVTYEGHSIRVSCSIGAAIIDRPGLAPSEALNAADLALYRAKRDGRGCWRLFDPALDVEAHPDTAALKEIAAQASERTAAPYPIATRVA
ncbi:MAG: diguanylate cyclase domain-containing protein [Labrys sp. (in: a-proteobacteria)]|jgi:diguanylate cyclase (GGDEF)-like protein